MSPTLVEKKDNELAIEEEPLLENMQIEEQHSGIKIENVLVGVDKFNFPIGFFNFGHGRGPTSLIYRKTFHCHKLSKD